MAYTTINKSTDYFNTVLYTGNGASTHQITGVGFQPDWNWHKIRNDTDWHMVNDAVRGANYAIYPNATNAQGNVPTGLKSFDSDGFTVGSLPDSNQNNGNFVSWNWKANGAGSANTDGAVSTTVSVNTTAGFSIVKYTGTGTTTNFGHGLGAKPNVILIKSLSSNDWVMNGDFLGSTTWQHKIILNSTAAKATANNFNDQAPTNSVFYLNSAHGTTNGSGTEYIAYCFRDVQGYSKFSSFVGNGSNDGSFCFTGMKPSFVMIKNTSATGVWRMWDNKRDVDNPNTANFQANASNAEYNDSSVGIDFLSNGFKPRSTDSSYNGSGSNYIYMAFAEAPLVGTNNVPCTAR